MSNSSTAGAPAGAEVVTVTQAARLTGKSEKTIRRYLPDSPGAAGHARLPNAHRDGDRPIAPWLIPVSDLVAAGLLAAPAAAGSRSGSEALARQRDERELAALRQDVITLRADNLAKTQLLADRDMQSRSSRHTSPGSTGCSRPLPHRRGQPDGRRTPGTGPHPVEVRPCLRFAATRPRSAT